MHTPNDMTWGRPEAAALVQSSERERERGDAHIRVPVCGCVEVGQRITVPMSVSSSLLAAALFPTKHRFLPRRKPQIYTCLLSLSIPRIGRLSSSPLSFSAASISNSSKMAGVVSDSALDAVQGRLMFEDECILVDEEDRVIGHDSKYNCHLMEKIESENLLHRAFSVFLFNSKYELLLQQRSATKVTFPKVWTNTCCSHPLYHDSELIEENFLGVRNAAQRKLFDELGICSEDLPVDEFIPLGRMLYKAPSDGKWGEHELDYLLFIVRDVNLDPNPEEVADVKYVNRDGLKELLRKADAGEGGIKLSPWFKLVVDNFLLTWWDHVEKRTLEEVADMKTIHKLT